MRALPIVVDYVSPSAVETYCDCKRKYALPKIFGYPKKPSGAANLGSSVHAQHEGWLRDFVPYDRTTRAGEIASCTMHLLPDPGVASVESEITFQYTTERGPVWLGGKLDLHWREQWWPIVSDHKTTGSLEYAKLTKEQLIQHPQAPIYAMWAMGWYGSDWAELRWNYATTKGKPKPAPSWHIVHRAEVEPAVCAAASIGHEIHDLVRAANERRLTSYFQIEPSPEACSNFGGCEFRPLCTDVPVY